jgi:hypothetical protein
MNPESELAIALSSQHSAGIGTNVWHSAASREFVQHVWHSRRGPQICAAVAHFGVEVPSAVGKRAGGTRVCFWFAFQLSSFKFAFLRVNSWPKKGLFFLCVLSG